jgi:hypothetical protein
MTTNPDMSRAHFASAQVEPGGQEASPRDWPGSERAGGEGLVCHRRPTRSRHAAG